MGGILERGIGKERRREVNLDQPELDAGWPFPPHSRAFPGRRCSSSFRGREDRAHHFAGFAQAVALRFDSVMKLKLGVKTGANALVASTQQ